MYDLNAPSTFKSIKSWFEEIESNSNHQAQIIVVGNKSDLVANNVNQYSGEHEFIVTSAKTGQNVDNLFQGLTKNVLQKIETG
jgi:GTPase SAR1 family protein